MGEIVSIDWCNDTIRRTLPWDPDQFIEVRRFTDAQQKKRRSLMTRFSNVSDEASEVQIRYDELAKFDYNTAISDFRLKDREGNVLLFGKPQENARIYDHFSGALAEFVDNLINEINFASPEAAAELEELTGNSESSSPINSQAMGED